MEKGATREIYLVAIMEGCTMFVDRYFRWY